VALDGESDSFALFDLLVQLRKVFPTTVVIFVDCAAHADDLTSERSAICDATLRGPVTEAQLRNGFAAAARNIVSRVGRGGDEVWL
jgi:3'-phosphoadenosine 5'-phosphosulfate sulfotransferase (PAPS reductase)/FAD synthetase